MTTASASPQQAEPTTAAAVASPPTSPPAKRVKTDNAASSALPIMSSAAATNGTSAAAAVTTLDQAPPLLIKKLSDKGRLPTRGSAFAAGYDIYAARETVVPARGKALVDTDISMAVPAGTCTLCPRVPFPSLSLALSSSSANPAQRATFPSRLPPK